MKIGNSCEKSPLIVKTSEDDGLENQHSGGLVQQ